MQRSWRKQNRVPWLAPCPASIDQYATFTAETGQKITPAQSRSHDLKGRGHRGDGQMSDSMSSEFGTNKGVCQPFPGIVHIGANHERFRIRRPDVGFG